MSNITRLDSIECWGCLCACGQFLFYNEDSVCSTYCFD